MFINKKLFSKISKYLPQIIAMLFLAGFVAYAWTESGSAPPDGNVSAPINTGPTAQTKQGNLFLDGVLRTLEDLSGTITLSGSNGVSMSNNWFSGQNWEGGGYGQGGNYSLYSPNPISFVFALPGNNCQAFAGDTEIAGANSAGLYSYSGSQPKIISFSCGELVSAATKTIVLRDASGEVSSGNFSSTFFLPGQSCDSKIAVTSLSGNANNFYWQSGGGYGTSWDNTSWAAIRSVKINDIVVFPTSGMVPAFGPISEADWNSLFDSKSVSANIDISGIVGGQKTLVIDTMWLHRRTDSVSSPNNYTQTFTYSVDSTASGAPAETPGVPYVAAAYECQ